MAEIVSGYNEKELMESLKPVEHPKGLPGGPLRKEVKDFSLDPEELILACKHKELIHPLMLEVFTDPDFARQLPERLRNPQILAEYLEHSSAYLSLKHSPDIYGEEVSLPETEHGDGRVRREESGSRILTDAIRMKGVDPRYVMYFRITQPSDQPKPEYYWTNDYFETVRGLTAEISEQQRNTAVIMCSNLEEISRDGGVMQDVNDDEGLAVRRISLEPFDQKRALFKIKPTR